MINTRILFSVVALASASCDHIQNSNSADWEATEQFAGGEASTDDFSVNAFGHAAPNLTGSKNMKFVTGNAFFKRNWVTAPSSTKDLDGLGPLFNARSCSSCHLFDGRGAPPKTLDEQPVDLLIRLSVPVNSKVEWKSIPEPVYGDQFNHMSVMGVQPEGRVEVRYEEEAGAYPDGTSYSLRTPSYRFHDLRYGKMHKKVMFSPRIAPHIIGLGLLEAIKADDLIALEDTLDRNEDGISGRLNYIHNIESGEKEIGRFGWKANQPSVRQQVAAAFLGDIGITSSLFPQHACSSAQQDCQNSISGGEPELTDEILDRVTLYSQVLAVPERRNWKSSLTLKGKQLFASIGCTHCHTPSFVTGTHPSIPEFSQQKIYPYTDLLLHDMGPELADNRPDGKANGLEWKTPPLWGIGLIQTVNKHTFLLHDGRARNVEEAILWHAGEAQNAKEQFKKLSKEDRKAVIGFVNSL